MNRQTAGLMIVLIGTLACGSGLPGAIPSQSGVETIVAGTLQALTIESELTSSPDSAPVNQDSTPTVQNGINISANSMNFVIPVGLGSGANVEMIPEGTGQDGPSWDVAPAYSKFTLQGYPLQGRFFEPHILVFPAPEFEALNTGAAQSLQKLRALLASPSAPLTDDAMPSVPTFNAGRVFTANMQIISFRNGSGVRMLTQYAQYYATANNYELFYNFHGLTSDGRHYIIGIFPVNASFLAADDRPDSVIPADGVPFPANGPDESYYAAVTQKLDGTAPEAFTPLLATLDALVQSMEVQ